MERRRDRWTGRYIGLRSVGMWHHLSPEPALRVLRPPVYVAPMVLDCFLAIGQRETVMVLYDYLVMGTPDRWDTEEDGLVTQAATFDRSVHPYPARRLDLPEVVWRVARQPYIRVWRHLSPGVRLAHYAAQRRALLELWPYETVYETAIGEVSP